MRRDGFTPSKQSKLCGKHFTIDCYEGSPWSSQKKLKSDAIPSIFDLPTRLKKSTYSRKPPKNRQSIISNNITNDSIQNNNVDNYIINVNNNITNDSIQNNNVDNYIINVNNNITNDSIQNNNVDNCIINVNNIITNDSIQNNNIDNYIIDVNNNITNDSIQNNNVANCQINPKNNGKRYIGDFNENDMLIPENSKKFLKLSISKLAAKQKKIKMLQQSKRCLIKRIKDLYSFLRHLKSKSMISEEISTTLMGTMSESTKQLFCRIFQGKVKKHYPPELRSFALTLNFYSAKAYSYVRKTFNIALPHPRTIQKWYESVDCSPGFSKEALVTLHSKVKEAQKIV
ncbi:putative uncharacterized protein DDB_G0286901 [Hydra vulgaris]|uniref:putative uncharacterized protein DDB_G0286901 n=1 Tax=Hydra vulgaris TaxID=6087 RepID=UPI001F5E880A|nr:putative uncharacterized protein DDB_G0286901 [Hydra vulgaris]